LPVSAAAPNARSLFPLKSEIRDPQAARILAHDALDIFWEALRNQTPPYDVIAVELEQLGSTMMLTVERMLSVGFEPSDEWFNRFLTFVSEKNVLKTERSISPTCSASARETLH
jgi:hypothetical protein